MKVPFVDLSGQYKELKKDIDRSIGNVVKRGDFILGQEVKLFEKEFAAFCETKYAVGVSSGTAALFLALKSMGIGEGDEVIVPPFTFIATAASVSYCGARPVFADIEKDSYNIDAGKIKKSITSKTKAIIPVHLYGQPANMPEIIKIARRYNLEIIEDAAQAHGAKIRMGDGKWRLTGGIGDIGCFSFYPTKNLGGMGDGGIITTNDRNIYEKLLILRDCGRTSRYEHKIIGYNSRLDTLQAAVLRVKLRRLNIWNDRRRESSSIYSAYLKDTDGITIPSEGRGLKHIFHSYAIRVKGRDNLLRALLEKGIAAVIYYPIPLHLQPAYKYLGYKKGDFPVAESVSRDIISLPMYPHLSRGQIRFITDTVKGAIEG